MKNISSYTEFIKINESNKPKEITIDFKKLKLKKDFKGFDRNPNKEYKEGDIFKVEIGKNGKYYIYANSDFNYNIATLDKEEFDELFGLENLKESIQEIQDETTSPDEEDCFVSSNGFKLSVSCGGKWIGDFEEDEDAYNAVKEWKKKNNWYPNTWFVSDHGNTSLVDDDGNSINEAKKENISISNILDIENEINDGKVTYRGCGFGSDDVKIKVKGKEYKISDSDFKKLGGIKKISFKAPIRKN